MLGGFLAGMSNVQLENATGFAGLTAEEEAFYENCEGIPCTDDIDFAIPRIMMENNENFYNLAMAVTSAEIQHFVATNEEVVYEEGKLSEIFKTVKSAIKKAWDKVVGIFKKVFETIGGWLQRDKKFVEKYEKIVREFKGQVKRSGYNYTHLFDDVEALHTNGAIVKLFDVNSLLDFPDDDAMVTAVNKVRGAALGQDSITSENFGKALKEYFRDGHSEKSEQVFTSADADKLLAEVKDAKDAKKAARASYDACKKFFKWIESEVKKAEVTLSKGMSKDEKKDVSKAVGRFTKSCNKCITISHTIMHAHIKAINGAHDQAKNVIIAISGESKKDKKEETNESGSMLEGFNLI